MVDLLKTKKRSGRKRKIIGSEELEKILLTEDCLKNMAHLSLQKRVIKIRQLYDTDVKKSTLLRFYKRNGLRYGTAKAELYPHNKDLNVLR